MTVMVAPNAFERWQGIPETVRNLLLSRITDIAGDPAKFLRKAVFPDLGVGYTSDFSVEHEGNRYYITLFAAYDPSENELTITDAIMKRYP